MTMTHDTDEAPAAALVEAVARAIHDAMGDGWAYSDYSGDEWRHCRDRLDKAARAAIAAAREREGFLRPGLDRSARDVIAERFRQVSREGWTAAHDDGHSHGELAKAAASYAYNAAEGDLGRRWNAGQPPVVWPWDRESWKPTDRRRDLVKAAALILAEIERLDRLAASPPGDAP